MASHAEVEKFCRKLRNEGFTVSKTGKNHLRIEHPRLKGPVFGSGTPSNVYFTMRKINAQIKRLWIADCDAAPDKDPAVVLRVEHL